MIQAQAIASAHVGDVAQEHLERARSVRGFDDIVPFPDRILALRYRRPEKTKSGLILAQQFLEEEEWQGKTFIAVKLGTLCFRDDDTIKFGGFAIAEGDWFMANPSYGRRFVMGKQDFLLFHDRHVECKVPEPDVVY